jgi:hypothetical protein
MVVVQLLHAGTASIRMRLFAPKSIDCCHFFHSRTWGQIEVLEGSLHRSSLPAFSEGFLDTFIAEQFASVTDVSVSQATRISTNNAFAQSIFVTKRAVLSSKEKWSPVTECILGEMGCPLTKLIRNTPRRLNVGGNLALN